MPASVGFMVKTMNMRSEACQYNSIATMVGSNADDLQTMVKKLENSFSEYEYISNHVNLINDKLQALKELLLALGSTLNDIVEEYENSEANATDHKGLVGIAAGIATGLFVQGSIGTNPCNIEIESPYKVDMTGWDSRDVKAYEDLELNEITAFASQYMTYPYTSAGTSPEEGFDCSGFVYYVLTSLGYENVPRSSSTLRSYGQEVSIDDMQPGDIICWSSHVAIYLGNGQIIHSSNRKTYPNGGVKTTPLNQMGKSGPILSVRRPA